MGRVYGLWLLESDQGHLSEGGFDAERPLEAVCPSGSVRCVFMKVGWLGFAACQPIGLFYAENIFLIFIWYNFYAYSYLNAINKYQRHQK